MAKRTEQMVPVLTDPRLTPAAWQLLLKLTIRGGHPYKPTYRGGPEAAVELIAAGLAHDTENGLLPTPLGKQHQVDRHRRHALIREKPLYADELDDRP